jgi:hypothetical protein
MELIYKQTRRSHNKVLYSLVKLLANTGLRRSEALELKWTDIDKANGLIHIRRSKTGRGRSIPLDPAAAEALTLLKRKNAYVFATNQGKRLRKEVYLQPLKRAVKRAGIKKRVDLHSLRHSYGSNKIRHGWGIKKVSLLLGHSNITITARVYTHLLDGDLRVQDDFRFDVDRNKTSFDTKSTGEVDEKVSQVLAQTIMNAAMKTEGGEKLLSELLAQLSRSEQRDPASSVEIAADFLKTSKSGNPAPLMLQGAILKSQRSSLIENEDEKKPQDPEILGSENFGVPTGIRTPVAAVKGQCPRPLDDGDALTNHQMMRTSD